MLLTVCVLALLSFTSIAHGCDDNCKNQRIKSCCEYFVTNKDCLSLCRYNTTLDELAVQGMQCSDQLKYWIYCAADEKDNSRCCQAANLNNVCLPFCQGKVPKICVNDSKSLSKFIDCATNADQILKCHKDNLAPQPKWQKTHNFPNESC